jgi:hypothetical protein
MQLDSSILIRTMVGCSKKHDGPSLKMRRLLMIYCTVSVNYRGNIWQKATLSLNWTVTVSYQGSDA